MLEEFKVATIDCVLSSGLHIRSFYLIKVTAISDFFKKISEDEQLRIGIKNIGFTSLKNYTVTSIRYCLLSMSQEEKDRWFYVVCNQEVDPADGFKALCALATGEAILKPCCIMHKEPYLGNLSALLIETV